MNKKSTNLFERGKITEEEWNTRIDLAACYRLMKHFEMDDLIYNHISARVPLLPRQPILHHRVVRHR